MRWILSVELLILVLLFALHHFYVQMKSPALLVGETSDVSASTARQSERDCPTVVTIGAGVIGLCSAYQLARANQEGRADQRIVVVEVFDEVFAATSGTNTGILSNTSSDKDLLAFTQYSFWQWKQLAKEAGDFRDTTGYTEGVNYAVRKGTGVGQPLLPNWLSAEPDWDAVEDPAGVDISIINPVTLGRWLYKECLLLGVEFRMNSEVMAAKLSPSREVQSIELLVDQNHTTSLALHKLVVAAGPWTPQVFEKLFPDSPVDLKPIISAGEFAVFRNPQPNIDIAATYLDDIVGEKLEFAGRNDHTIWGTGVKSSEGQVPLPGHVAKPDPGALAKLQANADKFLANGSKEEEKHGLVVLSQGRSYRPSTEAQKPIIAAVSPSKLALPADDPTKSWETSKRRSVYVNYGHGSHGILLGMGSGRLITQLLLGEEPDITLPATNW